MVTIFLNLKTGKEFVSFSSREIGSGIWYLGYDVTTLVKCERKMHDAHIEYSLNANIGYPECREIAKMLKECELESFDEIENRIK